MSERKVGFGSCPARRCDAAELAPRAGAELAPTRRSQFGLRLDLGLSPREELCDAGFPGVDVASSGLVNRHRNIGDVIQIPEHVQRTQRVQHQLRVALGLYEDVLPVLQIDYLQLGFSDDHTVAGAKPARHDVAEVETLLDQHLRITTGFPRQRDMFLDERHVVVGQVLHLGVDSVGCGLEGRRVVQGTSELPLGEGVCDGALFAAADEVSCSRDSRTALGGQFSHRRAPDAESNACWSGIGQLSRLGEQPAVLRRVNR